MDLPCGISCLKTSKTVRLNQSGTTDEECDLSVLFGAYKLAATENRSPQSSPSQQPKDQNDSVRVDKNRQSLTSYLQTKPYRKGSPNIFQCRSASASGSSNASSASSLPVSRKNVTAGNSPPPVMQSTKSDQRLTHVRSRSFSPTVQELSSKLGEKDHTLDVIPRRSAPNKLSHALGRSTSVPTRTSGVTPKTRSEHRSSLSAGIPEDHNSAQLSHSDESSNSAFEQLSATVRRTPVGASKLQEQIILEDEGRVYLISADDTPTNAILVHFNLETRIIQKRDKILISLGALSPSSEPTTVEIDMSDLFREYPGCQLLFQPEILGMKVHSMSGWVTGQLPGESNVASSMLDASGSENAEANESRYPGLISPSRLELEEQVYDFDEAVDDHSSVAAVSLLADVSSLCEHTLTEERTDSRQSIDMVSNLQEELLQSADQKLAEYFPEVLVECSSENLDLQNGSSEMATALSSTTEEARERMTSFGEDTEVSTPNEAAQVLNGLLEEYRGISPDNAESAALELERSVLSEEKFFLHEIPDSHDTFQQTRPSDLIDSTSSAQDETCTSSPQKDIYLDGGRRVSAVEQQQQTSDALPVLDPLSACAASVSKLGPASKDHMLGNAPEPRMPPRELVCESLVAPLKSEGFGNRRAQSSEQAESLDQEVKAQPVTTYESEDYPTHSPRPQQVEDHLLAIEHMLENDGYLPSSNEPSSDSSDSRDLSNLSAVCFNSISRQHTEMDTSDQHDLQLKTINNNSDRIQTPTQIQARQSSPEYNEHQLYDLNSTTTPIRSRRPVSEFTQGLTNSNLNTLAVARQRSRSGSISQFQTESNHQIFGQQVLLKGVAENSPGLGNLYPQYNSVVKVDFTPSGPAQKYPILTCFFVLTFTESFLPTSDSSMMIIDIRGPKHTSIMMARVEDESVPWDIMRSRMLDDDFRSQIVQIQNPGYAAGQAFCLVTNCVMKDFGHSSSVKLPSVSIAQTKPSSEDILLAKARYPLYVKLDLDEIAGWVHIQRHKDELDRWKFERVNIAGRPVLPMTIKIATLPQLACARDENAIAVIKNGYTHSFNVEIGQPGTDPVVQNVAALTIIARVVRTQKKLDTDPLLRIRFAGLVNVVMVEVDDFPATCYTGLEQELIVMDTDKSMNSNHVEIEMQVILKCSQTENELQLDLPVVLGLPISSYQIAMRPGCGNLKKVELHQGERVQVVNHESGSQAACISSLEANVVPRLSFDFGEPAAKHNVNSEVLPFNLGNPLLEGNPSQEMSNGTQLPSTDQDRKFYQLPRALAAFTLLLLTMTFLLFFETEIQTTKIQQEIEYLNHSGSDLGSRFDRLIKTQLTAFDKISAMQDQIHLAHEVIEALNTKFDNTEIRDTLQAPLDQESVAQIDDGDNSAQPNRPRAEQFQEIYQELEAIAVPTPAPVLRRSAFEIDPEEKAQFKRTIQSWFSVF